MPPSSAIKSTENYELIVDFSTDIGKMRLELHSAGYGTPVMACPQQTLDEIRSMGFNAARTHDQNPIIYFLYLPKIQKNQYKRKISYNFS